MQEEPKLEFSHGDEVRIATEPVFSTARQDIAFVPLEGGCSSSSYRQRFSGNAKDRVPSTGLLHQLPPAAAGFPDISQAQVAQPFSGHCLGHDHQMT